MPIQIAYLKHFEEPLSIFVHDSDLDGAAGQNEHPLNDQDNLPIIESLLSELATTAFETDDDEETSPDAQAQLWQDATVESLAQMVDDARESFFARATNMRVAYQVFTRARVALQEQGIRVTMPAAREETTLEFMSRVMKGRAMRDVNHLVMTVKCVICVLKRLVWS